jgi:hypothetical protein
MKLQNYYKRLVLLSFHFRRLFKECHKNRNFFKRKNNYIGLDKIAKFLYSRKTNKPGVVAYTCNPSHSGGDGQNHSLKQVWTKS